jgi:hypothetical protein
LKVQIDIRAQRALSKRYWRDTRKLLAIIREPVNHLSEFTDPDRLKDRVPYLLDPKLMEKHLLTIWGNVGGKFGYEMENAIKKAKSGDPAFELKEDRRMYWNERSMQLAAKRAGEKAVKILDSETEAINRVIDMVIEKANVEGMGIPETRRLMRDFLMGDEMATIENYQAERIARMEVGSASNSMSFMSAQENAEGVTKGWLTSGRTKIRDSHILYGSMGDKLPMDFEYAPGLKFPQDPDCQIAEEVINCRCTHVFNVD